MNYKIFLINFYFQDSYVFRAAPWVGLGASASLCNNVMGVT